MVGVELAYRLSGGVGERGGHEHRDRHRWGRGGACRGWEGAQQGPHHGRQEQGQGSENPDPS